MLPFQRLFLSPSSPFLIYKSCSGAQGSKWNGIQPVEQGTLQLQNIWYILLLSYLFVLFSFFFFCLWISDLSFYIPWITVNILLCPSYFIDSTAILKASGSLCYVLKIEQNLYFWNSFSSFLFKRGRKKSTKVYHPSHATI